MSQSCPNPFPTLIVQGEELLPMWNHSSPFGSYKSGDLDNKAGSPVVSAGTSAGTVSSERSEAEVETWMILEYCDKGSLQVRTRQGLRVRVEIWASLGERGCWCCSCLQSTVESGLAAVARVVCQHEDAR